MVLFGFLMQLLAGGQIARRDPGAAAAGKAASLVADLIRPFYMGRGRRQFVDQFQVRLPISRVLRLAIGAEETAVGHDDEFRGHIFRMFWFQRL